MKMTNDVIQYFMERKVKSKLFTIKYKINIHEIINHNTGLKRVINNDVALLRSVKNYRSLLSYFLEHKLDPLHKRRYYNFKKYAKKILKQQEQQLKEERRSYENN